MKKTIALRLCIVIVVSMIVTLLLSYYLQIKSAREAMYAGSVIRINQIEQILERNDAEVEQLKADLKQDYIIRAKAAAYIIQNSPEVIGNLDEIKKITALLQVDELHLFDPQGTLYFGSEPQYYNYTFNSGEQMQFFLPLLTDYSLELSQDVTPNTAEGKMMQYVALWQEDHKGIIQIGMEPVRLLEAMKKNELSHLFSMLTVETGITAFAADRESGVILGSTDEALTGQKLMDIGITLSEGTVSEDGYRKEGLKDKGLCVLKESGQAMIGVSSEYHSMYQSVPGNMALVIFSLCILSFGIILLLLNMIDRYIINGIKNIIAVLRQIAGGDLDSRVEVSDSQEFVELSSNINDMVKSLLDMTGKLSLVFENVNIPIAVYEYNLDMKRVLATSKIGEILKLTDREVQEILSSREIFCSKIEKITADFYDREKDVYLVNNGKEAQYIRIKSYKEGHKTLGILVDVTEEVVEKQQIKKERDIDLLTGLYSRRAFFDEMERIFSSPESLKMTMFLMVDLDNLKYVNDSWGHENGDRLLQAAAGLLSSCPAPCKVVTRLSGDEFVLVIYGEDSEEDLLNYLDLLHAGLEAAAVEMPGGDTIKVRISGGYVIYPEVDAGCAELLHLADLTMYHVKRNGKGYFEKYYPGL